MSRADESSRADGSGADGSSHRAPRADAHSPQIRSDSPVVPAPYSLSRDVPGSIEYRELRRISGLSPRTAAQAVGALGNSWAWAIVRDADGVLVSMGRVIGDGTWYFHFADVATHPEHRRRGLSRAVMTDLIGRIDAAAPPHPYISLIADPPGQPFYAALGFADADPSIGMILPRLPDSSAGRGGASSPYARGMKPFHVDPDDPRTPHERMIAGDWYRADDPQIQAAYQRGLEATSRFAAAYPRDPEGAQEILRDLLGELGDGAHVRAPLFVDYGTRLFVGAGTFVNFNLTALDVVDIRIGRDCQLGPNIQLLPPIHPLEPQPRRDGWEAAEPITIGDNVWIGGGATVLGGVTIGDHSVIGAGAVVTKDVPARSVAVGNPARVIREL